MYEGNVATIPLGAGGLHTDDPHTVIPVTKLARAVNISLLYGKIEKDFGSRKWNNSALPDKIRHITDWWPDSVTQRFIAVCDDGKIYKFRHSHFYSEITPDTTAPGVLNTKGFITSIVCGAESTGNDKKVFVFTGNNPIQVITADESERSDISKPAADWDGHNQPFKGIIHRGYLFAFGNENAKYRVYRSASTDHEDFTTTPWSDNVFPGEGDRLIDAAIFKGKLLLFKAPTGIYILNDSDASAANWFFEKFNESVGASSPFSVFEVLNDLLIANERGTMTSLSAIEAYGDVKSADIFNNLRVDSAIRQEMNFTGENQRHVLYYAERKIAYITYQSLAGIRNDRFVQINFSKPSPEITIISKDQPNCLGLKKDNFGVKRPFYGADDGYIYEMDRMDRDVGGNAYRGEFQTPNMDMGNAGAQIADKEKNFDFLEVVYEPTGDINLTCEFYVDGRYINSVGVTLNGFSDLGDIETDDGRFDALCPLTKRVPINCQGRRISIRCYNETLRENFKIAALKVYYKLLGEKQTVRN